MQNFKSISKPRHKENWVWLTLNSNWALIAIVHCLYSSLLWQEWKAFYFYSCSNLLCPIIAVLQQNNSLWLTEFLVLQPVISHSTFSFFIFALFSSKVFFVLFGNKRHAFLFFLTLYTWCMPGQWKYNSTPDRSCKFSVFKVYWSCSILFQCSLTSMCWRKPHAPCFSVTDVVVWA